jgi:hypothetical protein
MQEAIQRLRSRWGDYQSFSKYFESIIELIGIKL